MSHFDNRRVLDSLSLQLFHGETLSPEQMKFLAVTFWRISNGEDANAVFGVRPSRGQKNSDAVAKKRMSLILHWVAGAVEPDIQSNQKPLTIAQACELAMETIVPLAKQVFPGADDCTYDAEYLFRCWSEPAYQHMRSADRKFYDADFPY